MKRCFRCQQEKEESEFYRSCAYCKKCDSEYRRKKRIEHKDRRRDQRMALWREKFSRNCANCGISFVGKGRTRKHCSTKCKLLENVIKKRNGCWEWKGDLHPNGYGYTTNHETGKRSHVHRTSYAIFKGEIPKGLYVCHACDNPRCINPEHLWIGTAKENMADAKRKNRLSCGRTHYEILKKRKGDVNVPL